MTEPHVEAAESSVVTENYGSVRTEVDDNENSRITRDGDCNESEQFKDELQNQGTAELTVGNVLLSGGMSLSISKQVSSQGCSRVFIVKGMFILV